MAELTRQQILDMILQRVKEYSTRGMELRERGDDVHARIAEGKATALSLLHLDISDNNED